MHYICAVHVPCWKPNLQSSFRERSGSELLRVISMHGPAQQTHWEWSSPSFTLKASSQVPRRIRLVAATCLVECTRGWHALRSWNIYTAIRCERRSCQCLYLHRHALVCSVALFRWSTSVGEQLFCWQEDWHLVRLVHFNHIFLEEVIGGVTHYKKHWFQLAIRFSALDELQLCTLTVL